MVIIRVTSRIVQNLRGLGTFAIIGPAILVFIVHGLLIRRFTADPILRRKRLLKNVHIYNRFALTVMRVNIKAAASRFSNETQLMVCNHMSYLDIMILAAIRPTVFVTSVDMGQVFFLGTMAELAGSIFVERRHRDRLTHDIWQIEEVLAQGFDVVFFPEGTSSNGVTILPFKRSLLTAAMNLKIAVRPLTLKYTTIDRQPFGDGNRDIVCWYGKASFLPHFLRLLSVRSIQATLTVHTPLAFEAAATKHTLSEELYRIISNDYHQKETEWLPERRLGI